MTEELTGRALRPLARVIDDEETVRNSTVFTLRVAGIEAVAYESALAFLENDDNRMPGCVILDVRMPEMNGLELQDEMLRRGIDLPIVFLTGHGDLSMAVMALQKGAGDFCEKPVEPERLRQTVRRLSDQNIEARKEKFRIDMMRNAFDAVPKEIEEAARLDGCSSLQLLCQVMLPLVGPGLATVALFAFFGSWNELLAALILISDARAFTLPVMLLNAQSGQLGSINWGLMQAGITLSILPCALLFLLLQRYYIHGLVAGAVKA